MLAASVDQQIIFAIAAAAYGIFVWWNDRRKKKEDEEQQKRIRENAKAAEASGQTGGMASPPAGQSAEPSEQEKLRKFLEALGVPSGQAPPSQPPRPVQPMPPPRPEPPPRTVVPTPRPVIVAPRPVRSPVRPMPVPRPVARPVEPEPAESRDPGHLETASQEMMRAAYHDPTMVPHTVSTPPALLIERPTPPVIAALKEAMRTPESLRAAVLVREVLGPPVGL
jgi:hypothetical protein